MPTLLIYNARMNELLEIKCKPHKDNEFSLLTGDNLEIKKLNIVGAQHRGLVAKVLI